MAKCYYCNKEARAQCQECGVFVCKVDSNRWKIRRPGKPETVRVICTPCSRIEDIINEKEDVKLDRTLF